MLSTIVRLSPSRQAETNLDAKPSPQSKDFSPSTHNLSILVVYGFFVSPRRPSTRAVLTTSFLIVACLRINRAFARRTLFVPGSVISSSAIPCLCKDDTAKDQRLLYVEEYLGFDLKSLARYTTQAYARRDQRRCPPKQREYYHKYMSGRIRSYIGI